MYKAALIGLGKIAWKFGYKKKLSLSHWAALKRHQKITFIAGYSPDPDEVEQFKYNCNASGYHDLIEMLEDVNPDVVSICSPQKFHASQVEICMDHQVPMIWLEKPAGISVAEVERLEYLRKKMRQPSKVLVNFQRRYTHSYRKLKKIIEHEMYGRPLSVDIHYSQGLVSNGSHMIDTLMYLFPRSEFELLWVEKGNNLCNPNFTIQISDQLIAQVSGIDSKFHNIDIVITCEQGRLSIIHGGMTVRVEQVKENDLFAGYYRLYDMESTNLGSGGFDCAFDVALKDLIQSFERDSQTISNLATALKSQALIEKVLCGSGQ